MQAHCQNAHWLFDVGLWSLDDDDRGIMAEATFDENLLDKTPLKQMVGRRITKVTGRMALAVDNESGGALVAVR